MSSSPGAAAAAELPNVLLVSVDTLRADHMSSYGYGRATSPALDDLLARGARFEQARTVVPLTAPALSSMLTSIHPHEHGSTRNGLPMRRNLVSFTRVLGRRGYQTAAFVGNWTLKDELSGMAEHFGTFRALLTKKRWFGFGHREATADDVSQEALDWLESHLQAESPRPVLLWVHYVEPHAPYRLRPGYLGQVGVKKGATFFSAKNRYDTEIAFVDQRIGVFLDSAFEHLEREDTMVVFVSDHGESLGDHGYWGHGRHLYDATLRIPMGVVWPGRIAPAVIEEPASILDLAPTLLGLLALPAPAFYQGFDWAGVLTEGTAPPRGRVTYFQAHRASVQRQEENVDLRRKGLLEVGRLERGVKELFRVTNERRRVFEVLEDPNEERSRSDTGEPPSQELRAWLEEVRKGLVVADDLPPPSLTEEDLDALRALGYID